MRVMWSTWSLISGSLCSSKISEARCHESTQLSSSQYLYTALSVGLRSRKLIHAYVMETKVLTTFEVFEALQTSN